MGYILSISMCMQNFITIFHSVQEIAPLSLLQNLELGKASTNEKCHIAISWARSCHINFYATVYPNIPLSLRDRAIFTFSEFGARQSLDKCHIAISWARSCHINFYATVYPNIPLSLRDRAIFTFSEFGARQSLDKCHFAIPWARSCQYQCVCKILSKYSKRFKS